MSTRLPFTADESLGTLPERAAERFAEVAIHLVRPPDIDPEMGDRINLAGFVDLSARASGWLQAAGVRAGDVVAVVKKNHLDIQALASAASRLGAIPALISPSLEPVHTRILLERLNPTLIVSDVATLAHGSLAGSQPETRTVVVDGQPGDCIGRQVALAELRGGAPAPVVRRGFDEPMVVTHTSGTTDVPKLVVHSARTISSRAKLQVRRWPVLGVRDDDRYAGAIAWNHARACDCIVAFLHTGLEILALPDGRPSVVDEMFPTFKPTIVETLPNTYVLWEPLAQSSRTPFASARMFVGAFDAIHPRTVRNLLGASSRRAPIWVQAYGQSEAGGITIDIYTKRAVRSGRSDPRTRSMGWPVPGMTKVRIVDGSGSRVPRGRPGRIEAASDGLALTYLGQEDLHRKRRKGDWWTMGDIGVRTRSGRVLLHDREIDQVAGLTSCLAIEDILMDRLGALSEIVIVHDADGGPIPVVCTYDDLPLDEKLWEAATADLPALGSPIHLGWSEVPRTGTLKVRRSQLEAQLRAGPNPAVSHRAGPVSAVVGTSGSDGPQGGHGG